MAKAVVAAIRDAGFEDLTVLARNATTGRALAERYERRRGWPTSATPPTPTSS